MINKKRWIKTFHDLALGLFVNAVYSLTQGDLNLSNLYVMGLMIIVIFMTNKEI